MIQPKQLPTQDYLNQCLTYNPQDGRLFWKERPRHHFTSNKGWAIQNTRFAGQVAGTEQFRQSGDPSTIAISINGRHFCAHRLIYALMGITVPNGFEVDHKDTNPFNNIWTNLRLATRAQNRQNEQPRGRIHAWPKGVVKVGSRFRAAIKTNRVAIHIGYFDTAELAHAAYCAKSTELFGEFARGN